MYIYRVYIYIYMCVCVCVCVCIKRIPATFLSFPCCCFLNDISGSYAA
jgi:hypothetical protein